jgi:rRNA maturation protein Rpf1
LKVFSGTRATEQFSNETTPFGSDSCTESSKKLVFVEGDREGERNANKEGNRFSFFFLSHLRSGKIIQEIVLQNKKPSFPILPFSSFCKREKKKKGGMSREVKKKKKKKLITLLR